jgi:hypothetical protein
VNNTLRIVLVLCGVTISCCAIIAWALVTGANGSIWILFVGFLAALVPLGVIYSAKNGSKDQEVLQMSVSYTFILALIAAGFWLGCQTAPNANWVLVLFILPALSSVYGCKKLGSRAS